MNFEGKVILVTGGSGLIGKAIISQLETLKATVINLDIVEHPFEKAVYIHCDITQPDSVLRALERVMRIYGSIDGLVNNAYPRTADWGVPFDQISHESWRKNIDIQLNSTFYITQQVLAYIVEQDKGGAVVNIASIYGVVGNDPSLYLGTEITTPAAYAAIKGGIINFTKYLAAAYGAKGIRINCVSPGGIWNNQDPQFVTNYENRVPLGRMGKPEDISPSVCFLLDDGARYITGQNLVVDGGWTII